MANIRSAYAEVIAKYLGDSKEHVASVNLNSDTSNYKSDENAEIAGVKYKEILSGDSVEKLCKVIVKSDGTVTIGGKDAKTSNISGN